MHIYSNVDAVPLAGESLIKADKHVTRSIEMKADLCNFKWDKKWCRMRWELSQKRT